MQQSPPKLKLHNKFEVLQSEQVLSKPAGANATSKQVPPVAPAVPGLDITSKKVPELTSYISKLETTISKLNRAQNDWVTKEKQLMSDNAALSLKLTQLESTSSQNIAELQRQITELSRSLVQFQNLDSEDGAGKKGN